jgi:predicted outer membrane lipoprotein
MDCGFALLVGMLVACAIGFIGGVLAQKNENRR